MIKPTITLFAFAAAFVLVGCASAGDYHSYRVTSPCTSYSYGSSYGGHYTHYTTTTRPHYTRPSHGHQHGHSSHRSHSYSHRPSHNYSYTYSSRPSRHSSHSYGYSSYRPTYGCSSTRFSYHY